ncbi:MAG: ABC transporter ATP-binding protein [Bacilli bacterium]|nr:ABC transporter ATP-binding protein [Bacilli bacterium]
MENAKKAVGTIDYPYTVGPVPEGKDVVLSVRNLAISFATDDGFVKAVRGVAFDLYKGETLCIVGESGSGKSVTSKTIMGILAGNAHIDSGEVTYEGEDLTKIAEDEFHRIRGTKIGMIFQDPLSSLNPIKKIGKQITEVMITNGNKVKKMYDNIINAELIKLKNDQRLLHLAKDEISFKKKDKNSTPEDIQKAVDFYNSEKIRLTPIIAADKVALAAKKKEAKKATDEFVKTVKARHKEKKAALNENVKAAKEAYKVAIAEENARFDKELAEISANPNNLREMELLNAKDVAKGNHIYNLGLIKAEFQPKIDQFANFISERRRYISELKVTNKEAKRRALKIMAEVGIPYPERRYDQYPFEFSGGMRQRIVIAIALTADPDVLICDEPTTALDVTIQAQILELINRLKVARNMSVMFITHDLGVVANMADRVVVMYAGKIVEYGTAQDIFYSPAHPYTWALLSSIPDVDSKEKLEAIPGTPPNMLFPPEGDAFALRSKYALGIDFKEEPKMYQISDTHYASTWLLDERAPEATMPKIVSTRIENSLRKAGK